MKCLPKDENDTTSCETPDKIKEYIKDIEVQQWIYEEGVDWREYDKKPVYMNLKQTEFTNLKDSFHIKAFNQLR